MKVILSVDAIRFPLTGTGRYTLELARHLAALPEMDDMKLFAGSRFVQDLPAPQQGASARVGQLKRLAQKSDAVVALRQWMLNAARKRALRDYSDHVFHGPNYYLPPFAGRSVVTIHDVSMFTMPQCHPPERVRFMQKEIAASLKQASFVITDSDHARAEIIRVFGWRETHIEAIPLACSAAFHPRPAEHLSGALKRFGLAPDRYCLFASTIEPRKNVDTLLAAYGQLPDTVKRASPLVLVGHRGWRSEKTHETIARAQQDGWARYFGYVSDEELPLLYAGARLFAFPSLYEGFGLPVLEAMASGVAVIASSAASLPEVGGKAACYVSPDDVDALSHALARGLEDENWRQSARQKGLVQAANFSWNRTAELTANIYRRLETA